MSPTSDGRLRGCQGVPCRTVLALSSASLSRGRGLSFFHREPFTEHEVPALKAHH